MINEPKNLDITDIEEGSYMKKNCFNCGSKQVVLVKFMTAEFGGSIYNVRTKNKIGMCTNKKCFRHYDLKACRSWIPDNEVLPNERPQGAPRAMPIEPQRV